MANCASEILDGWPITTHNPTGYDSGVKIRLALLGFGNVGTALARLILEKRSEIAARYGLELSVVAIATGRHGIAHDVSGLDLERALEIRASGGDLSTLAGSRPPMNVDALLEGIEAEAALESVPVDYESGQPALRYLEAALRKGMHAITANKGPVVHGYRKLTDLAEEQKLRFLFEATVMDGTPIFSTWRECMPGAQLTGFRGILNSTTNYLVTKMEEGMPFDEALAKAQEIGVAETDPSGDIDGWDAAIKVAALSTVLMEVPLRISEVEREGIADLDVQSAAKDGQRWKLVCSCWRDRGEVRGRVRPERLGPDDPLFHVRGTSSVVSLSSDVLGDLTIMGTDPGPGTTAYGMFADLLNAVRSS